MKFSEIFHPFALLERISFSSSARSVSDAALGVGKPEIGNAVVSYDFEQAAVGSVQIFILEIEHGIDEVVVQQGTEAVLPPESRENRAVIRSVLAAQIEFGGPPAPERRIPARALLR